MSLVLASVAKGPAPAYRFPSRISCACSVWPVTTDNAVAASNPQNLHFIAPAPLRGSTDLSDILLARLGASQIRVAQRRIVAQFGRQPLHDLAAKLQDIGSVGEFQRFVSILLNQQDRKAAR